MKIDTTTAVLLAGGALLAYMVLSRPSPVPAAPPMQPTPPPQDNPVVGVMSAVGGAVNAVMQLLSGQRPAGR